MPEEPTKIKRVVKKFARNSAHIIVPKSWIGKEVDISLLESGKEVVEINWNNIKKMIDETIEEAKRGY